MNGYRTVVVILVFALLMHLAIDLAKFENFMVWFVSLGAERIYEIILCIVVVSLCKFKADRKTE